MKGMRKWLGMILCMLLVLLAGCGQTGQQATTQESLAKDQIYLYYVNRDQTNVVKEKYTLKERGEAGSSGERISRPVIGSGYYSGVSGICAGGNFVYKLQCRASSWKDRINV